MGHRRRAWRSGEYFVEGLARAGVGRLVLVDFDQVRPSNLNRQLYALYSTLGTAKCDVALSRVHDINPSCRVEALNLFVHTDTIDQILSASTELVIDAIDSFTPKVELLAATRSREIPSFPLWVRPCVRTRACIRIGSLDKTHHCPLAAKVRKKLRTRNVPTDFTCVYSIEPVIHLPQTARATQPSTLEEELHDRGRVGQTLGSLPTLTGIFGLTVANVALKMLLKELFRMLAIERDCFGALAMTTLNRY